MIKSMSKITRKNAGKGCRPRKGNSVKTSLLPIQGSTFRVRRSKFVNAPAFTILELLVAMTVLGFFVFMLFSVLNSTSTAWSTAENRMDATREARAALAIVSRDISGLLRSDEHDLLFLNAQADDRISVSANLQTGELADTFFFLGAFPAQAQDAPANRSDVCAVGYYVSWSALGPVGGSYNLYRFFRSSDSTFAALTGTAGEPLVAATVTGDDLLARNIRSFRVTPYRRTDAGLVSMIPDDPEAETTVILDQTPDMVEVRLTALNYNTARRLRDLGPSGWGTALPEHAQRAEQEFVVRIKP